MPSLRLCEILPWTAKENRDIRAQAVVGGPGIVTIKWDLEGQPRVGATRDPKIGSKSLKMPYSLRHGQGYDTSRYWRSIVEKDHSRCEWISGLGIAGGGVRDWQI